MGRPLLLFTISFPSWSLIQNNASVHVLLSREETGETFPFENDYSLFLGVSMLQTLWIKCVSTLEQP